MDETWKPERPETIWPMIHEAEDGWMFLSPSNLSVIVSGVIEDGKRWLHVSFARKSRMPEYTDMAIVKRLFIGEDRKAIMILPEKRNHVNIHRYCLHLWSCLDGDGLPEFSHGIGTL